MCGKVQVGTREGVEGYIGDWVCLWEFCARNLKQWLLRGRLVRFENTASGLGCFKVTLALHLRDSYVFLTDNTLLCGSTLTDLFVPVSDYIKPLQ